MKWIVQLSRPPYGSFWITLRSYRLKPICFANSICYSGSKPKLLKQFASISPYLILVKSYRILFEIGLKIYRGDCTKIALGKKFKIKHSRHVFVISMSNLISFLFLRLSAYITLNWGPRGIRELCKSQIKKKFFNILSSFS